MRTYRQPFSNEWPITQRYGEKITSKFHTGIDYGCPFGTSILASSEGRVMFAGWDNTGYGNMVIVKHTEICSTCYAHLSDIYVKVGDHINQGDLLGHSGSTGNSTGPHLHFEARMDWNNYRTHFDPFELPLMSVVDLPSKSDENKLLNAEDLKEGTVVISCDSGAFGHELDFSDKWVFNKGTKFRFTGNVVKRGQLEFCECELKVLIAVNDQETQILKNI